MIASFFKVLNDQNVQCQVCPHECIIQNGKSGICRIRKNVEGELIADTYRKYSAISFDPIEKKPLYHFFPGKDILSVGSIGCNLTCKWCQNCEISQAGTNDPINLTEFSPEDLLRIAKDRPANIGIAFTYNEPLINVETNLETARLFKKSNFQTVLVTNGFFSQNILAEYLKVIDAFNVDIKAFDDNTYRKYTSATLQPVLEGMKEIKLKRKHLELTYLVVPEVNDDLKQFCKLCSWIAQNIGDETVLHISRYYPRFKMNQNPTPEQVIIDFADVAEDYLKYVYVGNIQLKSYNHTKCPDCQIDIVNRYGYMIRVHETAKDGNCPKCKRKIFIS